MKRRKRAEGGSAAWISVRRHDDAHPGGGTEPREGQQREFRPGDKTTHILVGEQSRGRVSRVDFGEDTRRRTSWWRNRAEGQQHGFRRGDKAAHNLVAEQMRGRVSSVDFGEETRRRTGWWWNRAEGGSAAWISARRRDDAHPGGGTEPREGQQRGFRRRDETTHSLMAEQSPGRVRSMGFGEETRRRTSWWRMRAEGGSAA